MAKTIIIFIVILLVIAGAWLLIAKPFSGTDDAGIQKTANVVRRDFSSTVLATGAVKPQVGAEVRVGARVSGKVERLFANIGDLVKKNQVIAELEKADLEALLASRKADLAAAKVRLELLRSGRPIEIAKATATIMEANASLTLAELVESREKALVKDGYSPQEAGDLARKEKVSANAQLENAQQELKRLKELFPTELLLAGEMANSSRALVRHAEVQLSYATIRAPISGVIASVSTEQGETVAVGLSAPTFVTIIDLERLQVDAFVDEVDIGKVRKGLRAVFTVDTFPGTEFEGNVSAIYPKAVIQDNVVNYDVVVNITTPYSGLLRPEMTASVTIYLEERKGVLAIPLEAVKRIRGRNVVYVLQDDRDKEVEVKVGWKEGRWVEIAGGLKEGQTVLLNAPDASEEEP